MQLHRVVNMSSKINNMAASMAKHGDIWLQLSNRIFQIPLKNLIPTSCQATRSVSNASQTSDKEQDELYKRLEVQVKGHDPAVLSSYEKFVTQAAKELNINMPNVWTPPKHFNRRTLLKSVHIYKKHRVQYEMRTHFKCFEIKHITGSTASTFIEYIQRNLPEGVAMKVTKHQILPLPEYLKPPQETQSLSDK